MKIEPEEIERLSHWNLNGRQIKNSLFMALSWCRQNQKLMTFNAIEDIITMTCPRPSNMSTVESPVTKINGDIQDLRKNSIDLLDIDGI